MKQLNSGPQPFWRQGPTSIKAIFPRTWGWGMVWGWFKCITFTLTSCCAAWFLTGLEVGDSWFKRLFTGNKSAELFTLLQLLFIKMFKSLISEAVCYLKYSIQGQGKPSHSLRALPAKGPQQIAELSTGRGNVDSINFFCFLS